MYVTSDYYRNRLRRMAACSSGAQGSCHASAGLSQGAAQTHGFSRPLRPSAETLQRLALQYNQKTPNLIKAE